MNKISIKPLIYTTLIGTTLGLGACQKQKTPSESYYVTMPDVFQRSGDSASVFNDTILVFDDVKVPKSIRMGSTVDEFLGDLKKLYPDDKYNFSIEEIGKGTRLIIEILENNTDNKLFTFYVDKNEENRITNKPYIIGEKGERLFSFDYNDKGFLYEYIKPDQPNLYSPLSEDIYNSLSEKNAFGFPTTSKNLLSNIKKITPNSITQTEQMYREYYDKGISESIEDAWWLDKDTKTKCLEHLQYCYETNLDYKKDFEETESQIVNEYYTGDKYTKKQKDEVLTVKNLRTGKETSINIEESLKRLSLREKILTKKIIQDLPAEVIEDIAIEIGDEFYKREFIDNFKTPEDVFAYYNGMLNTIKIVKTIYINQNYYVVHELGHAVDYDNENKYKNSSSFSQKYSDVYEKELQNYIDNGGEKYSEDAHENKLYSTKNIKEMFAECYTTLMLGKSKSDPDFIINNFPKTFEAVKEHLKYIRSLPNEERNKYYKGV